MSGFTRKCRRVLGHPMTLGTALGGAFVVFTAAPGAIHDAMALNGGLFVLNVLLGNYRLGDMTRGHLAAIGIPILLVAVSAALPDARIHGRSLRYLMLFPGMVMATHLLTTRIAGGGGEKLAAAATVLVCLCVSAQLVAFRLWYAPGLRYGFYDNQHHLGLFASLALVWLFWVLVRLDGWRRGLVVPWATAALYLLWKSASRVSWLVFFCSLIVSASLFMPPRGAAVLVAGMCLLALASAWMAGFVDIGVRVADLWSEFWSEERMLIWPATLEFMRQNTLVDWLFGRGIGSFRFDFKARHAADPDLGNYPFPHNAVLQLLFENGFLGLALVAGAIGVMMWSLWRLSRMSANIRERHLGMTLFALLCIEVGQCMLTKSIYSKYILFSLSLVVGACLVFVQNARQAPPLPAPPTRPAAGPTGSG